MCTMKRILFCCRDSMSNDNNTGITLRSFASLFDAKNVGEIFTITRDCCKVSKSSCDFSIKVDFESGNYSLVKKMFNVVKQIRDQSFINRLKSFNPDCLYLIAADISFNFFALKLSKKLGIPIIIHHFDNIRESYTSKKGILKGKILSLIHGFFLKKIERNAIGRLTIGEEMSIYYHKRYGFKYDYLMNSVDSGAYLSPQFRDSMKRIVYTGGLHLDRVKTLIDAERAIANINNSNIKLFIYSSDYDKYKGFFNENITVFNDFVEHDKIDSVYKKAYILLHVESFNEDDIFYRYSISTKISEYMIASKPIICFAPKHLAVSKLLSNNNVGLSVDNKYSLTESIKYLIEHEEEYKKMSINAYDYAEKHFSKQHAKRLFTKYGFSFENGENNE